MSDRTKRRKVSGLAGTTPTSILTSAAIKRFKESPGMKTLGRVIKKSSENPEKAKRILEFDDKPLMMTEQQALALKINCDLSDQQYQMIRNVSLQQNADIFPPLKKLLQEKKECYPESLEVSEVHSKVPLQSMLDHTLKRILSLAEDDLSSMNGEIISGRLYVKLGMDRASSQSIYNQRFDDVQSQSSCEDSLFLTSMTPLKLVINEKEIWTNPKPSSPHFTRPLHMQYKKETTELTVEEEASLRKEIEDLTDFDIEGFSTTNLSGLIQYKAEITMLDGKAVNAITDTKSSQSCNICSAKPNEMNDLCKIRSKPPCDEAIKLGASPLHMLLRSFECFLKIGYKMDIKKFMACTVEEKESVKLRKMGIQAQFKEKLSLRVDFPRQGFGTSNTGNTARKFYDNSEISAEILGIDEDLIRRARYILKALSSGYFLDIDQFKLYCHKTSELFVEKYGWYTMPPSLHWLL